MNAKQLKEQEVEECLDRERIERTPRYPLPKPVDIISEFDSYDNLIEATGLKPHWYDRKCWCGTQHYDE